MKEKLETLLEEQGDPRMFGKGDLFDRYKYSGKDSMYYNRRLNGETLV